MTFDATEDVVLDFWVAFGPAKGGNVVRMSAKSVWSNTAGCVVLNVDEGMGEAVPHHEYEAADVVIIGGVLAKNRWGAVKPFRVKPTARETYYAIKKYTRQGDDEVSAWVIDEQLHTTIHAAKRLMWTDSKPDRAAAMVCLWNARKFAAANVRYVSVRVTRRVA